MDFMFDCIATGRTIKCLVIVDDATHESVAIVAEHSMGGDHLIRVLDQICAQRGRPSVIRADNGPEFCGKAMLTWAHRNDITLRPIELGKPNQNAYRNITEHPLQALNGDAVKPVEAADPAPPLRERHGGGS
jgi:putative transposase